MPAARNAPMLAAMMTTVLAAPTWASSDDSWAEFRVEVEETCLKVPEGILVTPSIVVDPFGSESYGSRC
jgi:hypothetical protein